MRGVAEEVGRRGGRRAEEVEVGVGVVEWGVVDVEEGVDEGVDEGVEEWVVDVGESFGELEVTVARTEVVSMNVEVETMGEKMGDGDVVGVVDDGGGEAVTTGSIVVVTVELETQPTPLQV